MIGGPASFGLDDQVALTVIEILYALAAQTSVNGSCEGIPPHPAYLGCFWWEELKRERGPPRPFGLGQFLADMHLDGKSRDNLFDRLLSTTFSRTFPTTNEASTGFPGSSSARL